MHHSDIRKQIHTLIDEANENQLDAVLEMLHPPIPLKKSIPITSVPNNLKTAVAKDIL